MHELGHALGLGDVTAVEIANGTFFDRDQTFNDEMRIERLNPVAGMMPYTHATDVLVGPVLMMEKGAERDTLANDDRAGRAYLYPRPPAPGGPVPFPSLGGPALVGLSVLLLLTGVARVTRGRRRSVAGSGFLSVILAATLTALLAQPASACSCAPLPSVAEARSRAQAVFEGVVTKVEPLSPTRESGAKTAGGHALTRVTFSVLGIWKGDVPAALTIETAGCGFAFQDGRSYVVYAYPDGTGGALATNLCTRTRDATLEERSALDQLGPSRAPPP
jgi:hypothetical protein